MYKKPLIVFEGIEGSGKTLHSKFLASYLKKKKINFIRLREPGGNVNSERIRKLIGDENKDFLEFIIAVLYRLAHSDHVYSEEEDRDIRKVAEIFGIKYTRIQVKP